jgi:hypothetical protein
MNGHVCVSISICNIMNGHVVVVNGMNGGKEEYMDWLRDFMGAYVSNSPRTAYINCMDLDLGTNMWSPDDDHLMMMVESANPEVEAARVWGELYFLGSYDRLVRAKTPIDPQNVFRNAQSPAALRSSSVVTRSPSSRPRLHPTGAQILSHFCCCFWRVVAALTVPYVAHKLTGPRSPIELHFFCRRGRVIWISRKREDC